MPTSETDGIFNVAVFTVSWETGNHAANWIFYSIKIQYFRAELKRILLWIPKFLRCRREN